MNKIIIFCIGGEVAQSVEQGTENPRVHSSILCLATIFFAPFPALHNLDECLDASF